MLYLFCFFASYTYAGIETGTSRDTNSEIDSSNQAIIPQDSHEAIQQCNEMIELTGQLETSRVLIWILGTTSFILLIVSVWQILQHQKRNRTEKKLGMQNSQLESVNKLFTNFLDQSIEAFTVFDSEGQIILWNKANENITGVNQEESLGKYIWDVAAKIKMLSFSQNIETEKKRLEVFFRKMISKQEFEAKKEEVMIEKQNGEIRTLMGNYFPVKISTSYYFGIILWDITERKEYEGQLIIAKDMAEKSDRLKSEFLAQISHEIRTPINTIVNNISLLKYELEDTASSTVYDSINSLSNAGHRIIRTIDLLINISAIHTGTFEIVPKNLDLYYDVIQPCVDKYSEEAKQKNIELIVNKDCKDLKLLADAHSLKQIADNLISNAIIFTDSGTVEININQDQFRRLYFEVIDSGIGISEEFLPKIYDPFAQEEQGYTRRYEGNGLGLTLVKEYCELNDATVTVQSKKGEGSNFKVTFNKVDLKSILL
jgi:PAS domain S-box-containing protein